MARRASDKGEGQGGRHGRPARVWNEVGKEIDDLGTEIDDLREQGLISDPVWRHLSRLAGCLRDNYGELKDSLDRGIQYFYARGPRQAA